MQVEESVENSVGPLSSEIAEWSTRSNCGLESLTYKTEYLHS
jgi:hypothetical protein